MIRNIFNDKRGRVKKLIILLFTTIFIFLILLGIYAAENLTNLDSNSISEFPPHPKEIINNSLIEKLISEAPKEIIEEIPEEIVTNETIIEAVVNETEVIENITGEFNLEENIIINETIVNENNIILVENQTKIFEEETESISSIQTIMSNLDIQLSYPQKITRGEIVEINATLTNFGNTEISNLLISWEIPLGFEIASGEITEILNSLSSKESYTVQINIQTLDSTSLGINEIKLEVNY